MNQKQLDEIRFHLYNFTKAVAGLAAAEATGRSCELFGQGNPFADKIQEFEDEYSKHQKLLYESLDSTLNKTGV